MPQFSVDTANSLNSNFGTLCYKQVLGKEGYTANHVETLCGFIKTELLGRIPKGNFLDIGAGPAFIAREIGKYFDETLIIEPNSEYEPIYKQLGTSFRIANFEGVHLHRKFDLALCSHVLYHVEPEQWETSLAKIYALLSPQGIGLIALISPRGLFHELCCSINTSYSHSQLATSKLRKLKIPFTIASAQCYYESSDLQVFRRLLSLFVIDDCFTPQKYE